MTGLLLCFAVPFPSDCFLRSQIVGKEHGATGRLTQAEKMKATVLGNQTNERSITPIELKILGCQSRRERGRENIFVMLVTTPFAPQDAASRRGRRPRTEREGKNAGDIVLKWSRQLLVLMKLFSEELSECRQN